MLAIKPIVRLPKSLVLSGEGWKVSIASAILPKMSLFEDFQSKSHNLIEIWQAYERPRQSATKQQGNANTADLRFWEQTNACQHGVDFINVMTHTLHEPCYAATSPS